MSRRALVILTGCTLVLLFGTVASAAIVIDSNSSAAGRSSSLTWNHTVGAGLDRLLIVGVAVRRGNRSPTSVTFGGVPLTNIGTVGGGGRDPGASLWGLPSPASGTANIVVTFNRNERAAAGGVSFDGVDQTTPWGNFTGDRKSTRLNSSH